MTPRRIILTTFGSLGDLHPYIALALGLQDRGHRCTIATSELYREKIEREGIGFAPVRPNIADLGDESVLMRKIMHPFHGTKYIVRDIAMAWIDRSYEDLLQVVHGADLIVGHPLTFAVPLVSEKSGIPWIGTALQPMAFLSSLDPPALGPIQWLVQRGFGPRFYAWLFVRIKKWTRRWAEPLDRLRKREGLAPDLKHPLLESVYSELGNLALFSRHFADSQFDWPRKTVVTGFPFYDVGMEEHHSGISEGLEAFLRAGPPPVVFTLGSAAVMTAGAFYRESYEAAKREGFRALLLVGRDQRNRFPGPIPKNIFIDDYAPYSQLFPRVSAIFHQGGVGTTAQSLRAGKPMVIMPFSHDQPDNANRIQKLGCGFGISRRAYNRTRVIDLVKRMMEDGVAERAAILGEKIRAEDGVLCACEAIESLIANSQGYTSYSTERGLPCGLLTSSRE